MPVRKTSIEIIFNKISFRSTWQTSFTIPSPSSTSAFASTSLKSLSLDAMFKMSKTNQLVPVLRICLRAHSFFFCLQRAVFFVCSACICGDSLQWTRSLLVVRCFILLLVWEFILFAMSWFILFSNLFCLQCADHFVNSLRFYSVCGVRIHFVRRVLKYFVSSGRIYFVCSALYFTRWATL